jgi:general secretion pathway protein E
MIERRSPFEANWIDIIKTAIVMGASDIHIEPREDRLCVRARVDGVLRTTDETLNEKFRERLLMQAKRACGFDMGLYAVPQDCRFTAKELGFDFRASLIPTLHGEKIVLRLLERNKTFCLENYPLPCEARVALQQALLRWQGLILVTGPTGSGKTTLLYSALASLDRKTNNVHSLEEPVEYQLEGLNQTPVTERLRFAQGVTTLMRQDPDVILIGEIRDLETAQAVIHAANTGHLVLSTLHANSAQESITRLEGLGVDPHSLRANLLFASAQRLVPKLCKSCREADLDAASKAPAGGDVPFSKAFTPMKAQGCDKCNGTGIEGRALLFEALVKEEGDSRPHAFRHLGSLRTCAMKLLKEGAIDVQTACAFG